SSDLVNAILYVVVGGIQWRMLPKEYPKWQSVYSYFRDWGRNGTWVRLHGALRAKVRRRAGRQQHPTGGCLASHSIKTTRTIRTPNPFPASRRIFDFLTL
ncbi:MAG: transposase, partial [Anaerolineaceae bacterium]|nr:transposase [Anaerolineaceae bacterium]